MKICLGSGHHRFAGYTHVDSNPESNPDVVSDALEYVKSLPENSVDSVIAWHILEHIPWVDLQELIHHLHRVAKPGSTLSIRVPHVTSIHAANPQHASTFSSTLFNFWTQAGAETLERYGSARFAVKHTKLRILALSTGLVPRWVAKAMPNWVFNSFGTGWQMLCERFWPFRFDEIEWELEVIK